MHKLLITTLQLNSQLLLFIAPATAFTVLLVYFSWKYLQFRRYVEKIKQFGSNLVIEQFFEPNGIFGGILGKYSRNFSWSESLDVFNELKSPVFYLVSYVGVEVFINDARLFHEICTKKPQQFPKAVKLYDVLRIFGDNIVTTDGEIWKRHRRLTSAAFSEKNNKLVLENSILTVQAMFDLWSIHKSPEGASHVRILKDMTRLTLAIISSAAFGVKINAFNNRGSSAVSEFEKTPSGNYKLSFTKCMEIVSMNTLPKVILPKWAFYIPIFNLPEIGLAFDEFDRYLLDIVNSTTQSVRRRQADSHPQQQNQSVDITELTTDAIARKNLNLLSLLVEAGLSEKGDVNDGLDYKLTTKEILGNAFIFMLAGHETSAHTLSFALALLALSPTEQEALYEDVQRVLNSPGRSSVGIQYSDIDKLAYCNAVMKESLRLFPPVVSIPKVATQHCDVTSGDGTSFHIPKDAVVSLQVYAMQRNEKYYSEPLEFRPKRWLTCNSNSNLSLSTEDSESPAFAAFSLGSRSCIGRRFAQIEIVVTLAMISQNYIISVPNGVTKERLLTCKNLLTLYPAHDDGLIFTERR